MAVFQTAQKAAACTCSAPIPADDEEVYQQKSRKSQLNSMAADPVSINLAIRASIQKNVPEEKISFGFNKLPLNQPAAKIAMPDLPEEKLWSSMGPVIELNRPIAKRTQSNSNCDSDEDEEPKEKVLENILSYGQLGYGFSKPNDPTFVTKLIDEAYEEFNPQENCNLKLGSVEPVCETCDNGEYRSDISYF